MISSIPTTLTSRGSARSAVAPGLLVVAVDSDRIRVVGVELGLSLLLQRSPGNGLESLLDVDGLLGRRLKVGNVALGLAPGHGAFLRDHSLALLNVNLVAEHNKGEVFRVVRGSLDEELVAPRVERLEGLGVVDIVTLIRKGQETASAAGRGEK